MREMVVAWSADAALTRAPLTARAGSDIFDEMKLDVLDHGVPIGGDHRECCFDVNGEEFFAAPSFLGLP